MPMFDPREESSDLLRAWLAYQGYAAADVAQMRRGQLLAFARSAASLPLAGFSWPAGVAVSEAFGRAWLRANGLPAEADLDRALRRRRPTPMARESAALFRELALGRQAAYTEMCAAVLLLIAPELIAPEPAKPPGGFGWFLRAATSLVFREALRAAARSVVNALTLHYVLGDLLRSGLRAQGLTLPPSVIRAFVQVSQGHLRGVTEVVRGLGLAGARPTLAGLRTAAHALVRKITR